MHRRTWIIILLVVGVGLAILIGALSAAGKETQAEAQQDLCSSLGSLQSSAANLTGLDPKTASKSQYQSDVSAVQDDWNQVKSDAQDRHNISMSSVRGAATSPGRARVRSCSIGGILEVDGVDSASSSGCPPTRGRSSE
jgi:hypothetical protein